MAVSYTIFVANALSNENTNMRKTMMKEGFLLPYLSLIYPEIKDPMNIPAKTDVAR